ncbi:MAG: hypothetical protein ONB11_12050 [candidate division KSB1 bacterium]|nr:hypothetical protein [candidate division KSB1 bacterium]
MKCKKAGVTEGTLTRRTMMNNGKPDMIIGFSFLEGDYDRIIVVVGYGNDVACHVVTRNEEPDCNHELCHAIYNYGMTVLDTLRDHEARLSYLREDKK